MADWGISPLGNLAQFEAPAFRTGEGLASILALKQRQQEQAQNFGADIGSSIGKQMEQRKKDEMYNVLMDNYSKEFGIENPFAGGGEKGYKAASELIKLRMLAQKQDLAERMGEARISRIGRASTGGGGGVSGGGGTVTPTGDPNIWEDPVSHKRFLKGPRGGFTPLGGPEKESGPGGAAGEKPLSQSEINSMLKGYGLDRADIVGGEHAGYVGEERLAKERPWTEAQQIEITPSGGGTAVKLPIGEFKRLKEQVYGTKEKPTATGTDKVQMPETRYGSEAEAKAAGNQAGETVLVFDPGSKRYRPWVIGD